MTIDPLADAARTLRELREAEQTVKARRQRFHAALREACKGGASYSVIAKELGISRQRVTEIVEYGTP